MNDEMEKKIERYQKYLEFDPENALLWVQLGDVQHQSGHFSEALQSYDTALSKDNDNSLAKARKAGVLISLHKFDEAQLTLESIAETKDDPALSHNLGISLLHQHKWQESFDAFHRAQSLGLKQIKNLEYQVLALHHNNQTEEALEAAQHWLKEDSSPHAHGYVSLIEFDHGDIAAAVDRAKQVLLMDADNADAHTVMGNALVEQHEIDESISHFQTVVKLEPDNPRGWQGLGLAQMYQQNYDKAMQCLEKAQSLMPENATNYLIMGWTELARKDALQSEKLFEKSIECDRTFGEAHGGLAVALIFQNRRDEARAAIKRSLSLDPEGFGAIYANSVFLQIQGKTAMGTKMLANLFERTPPLGNKPLIEHIQRFLQQQQAGKKIRTLGIEKDNKVSHIKKH